MSALSLSSLSQVDVARLMVTEALDAISTGSVGRLEHALSLMPLEQVPVPTSNSLLLRMLGVAFESGQSSLVPSIVGRWEDSNPMEDVTPIRTTLYTLPAATTELLAFVDSTDPSVTYQSHIYNLIGYRDSPEIEMACDRLRTIYGLRPAKVYTMSLDRIAEMDDRLLPTSVIVMEHLQKMLKEVSEYAPEPKWLIRSVPLPTHRTLVATMRERLSSTRVHRDPTEITDEEGATLLVGPLAQAEGLELANAERTLESMREWLRSRTPEEKLEAYREALDIQYEYNLHNDTEVFRVMGPTHCTTGITELDADSTDPCSLYGGCRLLTCYEHENIDEIDNEVIDEDLPITRNFAGIDWFRGTCDFCHRKIRAKHHAVRMPLDGGGWQGCYCSWEHVRLDVPRPNQLRLELIASFEGEYLEVGLLDRIWEDEEELPPLEMTTVSETLWDLFGLDFSLVTKREGGSQLQLPPMVPPSPVESPYESPVPSPRLPQPQPVRGAGQPQGLPTVTLPVQSRTSGLPKLGPLVLSSPGTPPTPQLPRGPVGQLPPLGALPQLPTLRGLPPLSHGTTPGRQ